MKKEVLQMSINNLWESMKKHEGETYKTVTGLEFTYSFINNNSIKVNRANQILTKNNFEKALSYMPLNNPGQISKIVRGSSYVYSIIMELS